MNFYNKVFSFLLLCLFPFFLGAQENATNAAPSSGNAKQEMQKENISFRKQKKIHDKEVKAYHKKLQTKKVRKQMKKDKRKAGLNNDRKQEFFLIRWFSKKK